MSYIAKYLNKWGWKVDVIPTYYNSYYEFDDSIAKLLPSKINIYRAHDGIISSLLQIFGIDKQVGKPIRKISLIARFLKRKLLFPDESLSWVPFASYKALNLINKNWYDVIFTSSFPFSSHLVGYVLKKITKIPWIAEYSDPWAYNPITKRSRIKFLVSKALEEKLLKETDAIVFMTGKTKKLYLDKFNFLTENKTLVIPSGYDDNDYSDYKNEAIDKFTILYAGTIRGRTNIFVSFFNAIKYLSSLMDDFRKDHEVIIIGKMKKELASFLTEKTVFVGYVNFFESLSYMKKACVLLLLGNEGGVQIPSKVYHYLGAKKPILAILGDENDPLKERLANINRVIIVNGSEKEIAETLLHLYCLFKSRTLFKSYDFSDIEEFTWEYSLKPLDNFLKKLSKFSGYLRD